MQDSCSSDCPGNSWCHSWGWLDNPLPTLMLALHSLLSGFFNFSLYISLRQGFLSLSMDVSFLHWLESPKSRVIWGTFYSWSLDGEHSACPSFYVSYKLSFIWVQFRLWSLRSLFLEIISMSIYIEAYTINQKPIVTNLAFWPFETTVWQSSKL